MKDCKYLKGRYCGVKAKALAAGRDEKPGECETCPLRKERKGEERR